MKTKTLTETRETQSELSRNGLGGVRAEFDDTDVCYLTGVASSATSEGDAVQIAQNHGARLVIDGIEAPGQSLPHLHRKHAVPGVAEGDSDVDTHGSRILRGGDLSDRLFDAGRGSVQTGTPLSTSGD